MMAAPSGSTPDPLQADVASLPPWGIPMSSFRVAAVAALVFLVAACSSGANVGSGGQLEGTQWVLRSYLENGTLAIVPETIFADAEFANHRVTGQAGCNSYNAIFQASGRTLLISQASTTLMACDEATMTFEQTYLALLDSSRYYGVRNETLTIYDGIGSPVLVFDAAPKNPLLGRWDVDSYLVPPSTVTAPIAGTTLDVVFGLASVGGSAGCNTFTGTYGTNGNVVRISQLATTRKACEQDVMDQETAFINALQGAALIDYRGDQVNLTDLSGSLVVALVRPAAEAAASASPSASTAPAASASARPSASPTPSPTPTKSPTPKPTATPTKAPAPSTPAQPSVRPSASIPPIPPSATCNLVAGSATVAKIVYPGTWHTVTTPANLTCQYFDPDPITVPSDPATLQTAVMASVSATSYADAVAAATDPANWTVIQQGDSTVSGTSFTCVEATAKTAAAGIPVGSSSGSCLVDVGAAGTVVIRTVGTAGDPAFEANSAVALLMTLESTFTPTT
jgi:heat shock protein HslJ